MGSEMLFAVLLLPLATGQTCLFPKDCLPAKSYPTPCCPLYNGSPCGEASARGRCVTLSTGPSNPEVTEDERPEFPRLIFSSKCVCNGNFSGVDCGRCKFNLEGPLCDKLNLGERMEIRQFPEVERIRYLVQLNYCKDKPDPDCYILQSGNRKNLTTFQFRNGSYYETWCASYYYAARPFLYRGFEYDSINFVRGGSRFLTYNRMLAMQLENQMQRCLKNSSFRLAYYDPQNSTGCDICSNQFMGANDVQGRLSSGSIFHHWGMVCAGYNLEGIYCPMSDCICERSKIIRQPGFIPGLAPPETRDMQYCMGLSNMDTPPFDETSEQSFRNCVEGYKNRTGGSAPSMNRLWSQYLGGVMAVSGFCCNDPMFVFQMVLIDKLMDRWIGFQNANEQSYTDTQNRYSRPEDCVMPNMDCWTHKSWVVRLSKWGVLYSQFKF